MTWIRRWWWWNIGTSASWGVDWQKRALMGRQTMSKKRNMFLITLEAALAKTSLLSGTTVSSLVDISLPICQLIVNTFFLTTDERTPSGLSAWSHKKKKDESQLPTQCPPQFSSIISLSLSLYCKMRVGTCPDGSQSFELSSNVLCAAWQRVRQRCLVRGRRTTHFRIIEALGGRTDGLMT